MRLDGAASGADRDQLEARRVSLAAKALRLRAEIGGQDESFADFGAADSTLLLDQARLLRAARQSYDDEQSVLGDRLQQRRLEIEALSEQTASLRQQLAAMQEQSDIREGLFKKGIGSLTSHNGNIACNIPANRWDYRRYSGSSLSRTSQIAAR